MLCLAMARRLQHRALVQNAGAGPPGDRLPQPLTMLAKLHFYARGLAGFFIVASIISGWLQLLARVYLP